MEELLKNLIRCKTVSASPEKEEFEKACEIIVKELERVDFEPEILEFTHPFKNIFAVKDFGREKTLAFVTHYDVVPSGDGWKTDPFEPVEKDGKIYGRGASDDKAGIAAFIKAVAEIGESCFNLKFFCFADEETGGANGIRKCIEKRKEIFGDVDAFYILDTTTEGVEIGACGNVNGKIVIRGKGGHSAYPFRYENAVEKGILLANKLMEFGKREEKHVSERGVATKNPVSKHVWNRFSVTVFNGGVKSNVIPGYAEIKFNWRLIPEEDPFQRKKELEMEFEEWKKSLGANAEMDFFAIHRGYITDEENEFVLKLKNVFENVKKERAKLVVELAATDGNLIYDTFKKPVMGFGPIDEDANIHGPNEFVRIRTLHLVKEIIKKMLKQNS